MGKGTNLLQFFFFFFLTIVNLAKCRFAQSTVTVYLAVLPC